MAKTTKKKAVKGKPKKPARLGLILEDDIALALRLAYAETELSQTELVHEALRAYLPTISKHAATALRGG